MRKFDAETVRDEINRSTDKTRIYFGCDSYRFKRDGEWFARYTTVVVIHKNGKNGCAVFGNIDTERDFDQRKDKPIMRMMNEVYRVSDMYNALADAIGEREVEIHLDINPDEKHGSNVAYKPALGYIRAMCGVDAVVKPNALASSFAADRFRAYNNETKAA